MFTGKVKALINEYAGTRIKNKLLKVYDGPTPVFRNMRIISWNVMLNDQQPERYQAQCEFLREQKADIICLQEVSPKFMEIAKQVLPNYHGVCHGPGSPTILTSQQCHTIVYSFQPGSIKKTVIVRFSNVAVACVHLPARDTGQKARLSQINQITELTDDYNSLVIAGDFNLWDGHEDEKAIPSSWTDAGTSQTATFDPKTNKLCGELHPNTNRGGRFDRFYVRNLQTKNYQVLQNSLSDHYPIVINIDV